MMQKKVGEWAEAHWDLTAMATSIASAVALSAAAAVAYNVTSTWLDTRTAPGHTRSAPSDVERPPHCCESAS